MIGVDAVRDESGTTLVELVVSVSIGLVILSALTMVIMVTLRGSERVSARVDATTRGRVALARIVDELHSACMSPEIAPIKEKSTGTSLRFIHQTGSSVAPKPTLSVISLSGETLTQYDYSWLEGVAPSWTFEEKKPAATHQLLTGVRPIAGSNAIFSYFAYVKGTISATPLTATTASPLSASDAALTVKVNIGLNAAPLSTPVDDPHAPSNIKNSVSLRLTPPSFNEGSPARPCQ